MGLEHDTTRSGLSSSRLVRFDPAVVASVTSRVADQLVCPFSSPVLELRSLCTLSDCRYHLYSPRDRLTLSLTFLSYSSLRSRHILAASTLAGLSSLGSASRFMTDNRIFSTDWMGDHRSEACS